MSDSDLELELDDILKGEDSISDLEADGIFIEESHVRLEDAPRNYTGIKMYLVAIVFGTLMTASSKYAMEDADQFTVAFIRMFATFMFSFTWLLKERTIGLFWGPPGVRHLVALRGLVGTLNLSAVYFAVQYLPLSDYAVISFLAPLITALSAHFVLGEPYHWVQAAASLVSLLGVVIITRPAFLFGTERSYPAGVTEMQYYVAVGAVILQTFGSATIVLLLRKLRVGVSPFASIANYALQTVIFSSTALVIKASVPAYSIKWPTQARTWLVMCFLGCIGFMFQFLMTKAYALEQASVLTQFDYLSLIFSMTWQVILWHSFPDLISIAGGALIILGVWSASRFKS